MTFGSGKAGQVQARRDAFSLPSLLSSTALLRVCRAGAMGLALSGAILTTPALADGGTGGNALGPRPVGGTDQATSVGGDGDTEGPFGPGGGGGGGGAGTSGGAGGAGFAGIQAAGGNTPGNPGLDGADGDSDSPFSQTGNGGGGGGAHGWVGNTLPGLAITGGNGGKGGDGSSSFSESQAGGGGAGGWGAVFTGTTGTLSADVNGGTGGHGGNTFVGLDSGGDGGTGGQGFYATGNATLTINSDVKGGRGGDGGIANAANGGGGGLGGKGGDGLVMNGGGSVAVAGTVMGGNGGDGGSSPVTAGDGGAGGAGLLMNSIGSVTVTGAVTGGNGGAGGISGTGIPFNGAGAMGGDGIHMLAGGDVVVNGSVTAGIGGAAVDALSSGGTSIRMDAAGTVTVNGTVKGGQGGAGLGSMSGVGGTGILMSHGGTIIVNAGGAVSGGDTGIDGAPSSGGFGIFGADLTVINGGTISVGNGVNGAFDNAVRFAGGTNIYEMHAGASVSGDVVDGTGNGTFRLGGATNGTFDVSSLASGTGGTETYRGFATFEKTGNSVWTVTGTSSGFTGDVSVNAGTLVVNGDLSSASSMFVNPGGTLSGTGTLPFTLLDDGATLAPGPVNGTGTLTINDRVMFCACSTYAVKVSATGNDRANIVAGGLGTGDAFLAGLVRVISPTGSYRFNSAYTILSTQGGLNGTSFDQLTTPTGIGGALSYTNNEVLLTLTSQLGQITGLNGNQQGVARAFDNVINDSGSIGALGGIFGNNLAQNLTQVSGELGTGSQQTTFQAMNMFMGLMSDPFAAGRGGGVGANSATGFADEESTAYAGRARSKTPNDAFAAFTKAPPIAFTPRWSTWAMGFGGSQTTDGNIAAGTNTSSSSIYGAAVGADYRFAPDTVAGFALAGGGTNYSVVNGGTGRSDLFQVGAFVRQNFDATYITASVSYGWQDVKTDRYVTVAGVDHLKAEFNTNSYSGRVELGHRFLAPQFGGVGVTPYAAAQVTAFELPSYAEQAVSGANTFALAYNAQTTTSTRSELGLRTDKAFALDGVVLTLRGRAAWAHDFDPNSAVSATFQTLPGASFVVNGAALASNSALTTASAELSWVNGWSVAGTFEGEFSNVTRSYAGKGVVRYNW